MKTQKRMKQIIFVVLALAIFFVGYANITANIETNGCEWVYDCHFDSNVSSAEKSLFKGIPPRRYIGARNDIIQIAHAEESATDTGIVKGIFTEKVDGIDYQKEIYYGKSGLYSLDEMIKDLKVEIYPEDKTKTFPDPSLGIGSKIEILRANPVVVIDAKEIKNYRTWSKTIKELLAEENIQIGEKDRINPSLDSMITRDLEVKIIRVAYTQLIVKESIDYKTVSKDDSNLEKGASKIEQKGKTGTKELTYQIVRENGKEVSRKLTKTNVTSEPQDKIIIKGAKVVSYGTGTATWYDWIGGMTAAHNSLAYGTMVRVVNVANGKSVDVKIVDHGIKGGAIIDLSDQAFAQLAPLSKGKIQVRLEKP